ncbi:MAG: L-lactate permease [Anaerolineae bacterium]|nr:L-lactate permease [Anaerolineae bacterium]
MQTPPLNLINWLLAFSPIAVVLVLMVGLRWGGKKAGPVGWLVAMGVAWLRFGAGPEVLFYSQVRGLLLTLYVLYIIWMALILYRVVDEAGAIRIIGQGIARLTAEPSMQLLLLAWAFSSFLQGVAGFGVPIAVVAPLLIGLGFAPVVAVAAVAIGHSWSVTFGDIASSFQALMAATGLPGQQLAPWSSFFLGIACFGCGLAAVWVLDGWSALRKAWPALAIMGTVMAAVQALLAVSGLWNLAGFGAGLAGLATGAAVARLPRYRHTQQQGAPLLEEPAAGRKAMPLGLALAPYLCLVIVVAAAELWPWLHQVLNEVQIRVRFPEVQTSLGWTTAAGLGRTISLFGHAGALLAYVALAWYLVYRRTGWYEPGVTRRILRQTVRSGVPSSIGIATMVGFAVAMDNSGMTHILARGLVEVAGPLYPLVSPFIGLLGAFMTGSNTNSNVVFAPLQQEAAGLLQISAVVILGAQTTGGSLGSMIAPAKLIVGCTTAGLAGREGDVLKRTLLPGLFISAVIGLLAWIAVLYL